MKLRDNFDFDPDRIRLIEVYRSIQGEGIDIGREVIFVRTSGCNLSCVWCDTKHSWTGRIGYDATPAELVQLVVDQTSHSKAVVITGGEPFVQDHKLLLEFVTTLQLLEYHVAWESNGLIVPPPEILEMTDLATLSPKLASSKQMPMPVETIQQWAAWDDRVQFKFVIGNDEDAEEAAYLITSSPLVRENQIPLVFQPEESVDKEVYPILPETMAAAFRKKGGNLAHYDVRYIPQTHKWYKIR